MTRFIETDSGWVNLGHVATVGKRQRTARREELVFRNIDGRELDTLGWPNALNVEQLTAPVIPAAVGAVAVVIGIYPEGFDDRPTDGDVMAERVPIVGWRITADGAEPVLINPASASETVLIEAPDGQIHSFGEGTYANLDEAKRNILRRTQDRWEQRQVRSGNGTT